MSTMGTDILIVDDEEDIRNLIKGILEDEGYSTACCANSDQAYELVKEKAPSLVILDIWLQGSQHDGLQILHNLHENYPHIPVLMISGHGTIETAVAAIKDGAYDFIEKPFKSDRLLLMIKRALETAALKQENEVLKRKTSGSEMAHELAGNSQAVERLRQLLERAAPTNSRVLLKGEPGCGKNLVARMIHRLSKRADKPYHVVNCATLQHDHLQLELFGSEVAGQEKAGLLEQVNGGTLLLDEVSDMSMETQAKIVRLLQEQRFHRLGSDKSIEVDVRILATTNKDLEVEIKEGRFREDFYYRLNVVPIDVPPLRERSQDIVDLSNDLLNAMTENMGAEKIRFSNCALDRLAKYQWPGNVRQLKNVIEWVLIMHGDNDNKPYMLDQLPPDISGNVKDVDDQDENSNVMLSEYFMDLPLREAREAFERQYLLGQVDRHEGNISKTAQYVGMERSALHRKIKSLTIPSGQESQDNRKKAAR
tara:strand:- start:1946 stop:3385 length:1440 start_codon:yes stop_codon:yes gene_type:complete